MIYEDGKYYIGQFSNNLRNGKGIVYYKNGSIKYEGDFVNDKKEGNGKYINKLGDYYIGEWKEDEKNGKGIDYYKMETYILKDILLMEKKKEMGNIFVKMVDII